MDHHAQILSDARARIFTRLDLMATPTPSTEEPPTGPLAWLDTSLTTCNFCRAQVAFRDTKVEVETLDYGNHTHYFGMPTSLELRVCSWH